MACPPRARDASGLARREQNEGVQGMSRQPTPEPDGLGALEGVRVLDLGHGVAGPFAARLLGDLGADVIKVEHPRAGDFARGLAPRPPPWATISARACCSNP